MWDLEYLNKRTRLYSVIVFVDRCQDRLLFTFLFCFHFIPDTESHIFNHKNGLQLPATNILQPYGDRMRDSYVPLGPDTMYQTQQQQPMLSQQQPGPQWMTDPHGTRTFNNWQQQQSQQQQPPMLPQEMSMNSMQGQLVQQQQNKAIFGQVPGQVPGNWVPVRQGPLQEQGPGLQGSQNGQMPIIAQVPVANVVSQGSSGDESGQKSGDVSKDSDSKDENTSEEEEESDSVTTEAPKVRTLVLLIPDENALKRSFVSSSVSLRFHVILSHSTLLTFHFLPRNNENTRNQRTKPFLTFIPKTVPAIMSTWSNLNMPT